MTIPAFLQFRKNSLNASISISDHFRLCPQPSGDNISAPQVYAAALTIDHNINEIVNFLRLSTYSAGHIRLNLAAEVVPFFTTNSVVWWKVLDQRQFCNFSDHHITFYKINYKLPLLSSLIWNLSLLWKRPPSRRTPFFWAQHKWKLLFSIAMNAQIINYYLNIWVFMLFKISIYLLQHWPFLNQNNRGLDKQEMVFPS